MEQSGWKIPFSILQFTKEAEKAIFWSRIWFFRNVAWFACKLLSIRTLLLTHSKLVGTPCTIDWWRFCTHCIFHKKVKKSLKDPQTKFEQLYNFGSKLCVHQRPMFFNHKANNSLSKLSGRLRYTFTPKKLGRQSLSPDRFFICLLSAIDTTFFMICTVFENHRKSLIQQYERSE